MKDGQLPNVQRALAADALATTVGGALGTSTVTSYVDSLDFGLVACRKTLPELNKLTAYLASEFEQLKKNH